MLESNSNQMAMKFTGYDLSYIETCISSKSRSYRDKVLLRARASEDRIIMNYKGLVISIASTYAGSGISLDDLIQV